VELFVVTFDAAFFLWCLLCFLADFDAVACCCCGTLGVVCTVAGFVAD
jgi:hypothetical protein